MTWSWRFARKFVVAFCICWPLCSSAQMNGNVDRYIYISNDSCYIKAAIFDKKQKIVPNLNHFYTWYAFNALHTTQGSYDGKLLTGNYKEFYLDNNLKQEGKFKDGKKNGLWKSWRKDGKLERTVQWKNGLRNGWSVTYNDQGSILTQQKIRNNQLHGKSYVYSEGKLVTETMYKHGVIRVPKQKSSAKGNNKNQIKPEPLVADSAGLVSDIPSSSKQQPDSASVTSKSSTPSKSATAIPQGKSSNVNKSTTTTKAPAPVIAPATSQAPAPKQVAPTVTKPEPSKKKWYQFFKRTDKPAK